MPILDPRDLAMLLSIPFEEVLGRIILLNRAPRYHNQLNAIELVVRLGELKRAQGKERTQHG